MTILEALQLALQHHRSGQLDPAERLYRLVLDTDPDNPDALHFLGVICRQKGLLPQSLELIQRSLQIRPDDLNPMINLALTLHEMERFPEAAGVYQKVLQKNPNNAAEISNNLGNIYLHLGQLDEAVHCYKSAIQIKPDYADALNNLGNAYKNQGLIDHAIDCYQKANQINPRFPAYLSNLIMMLNYSHQHSASDIHARLLQFSAQFAQPHASAPAIVDPNPHRKLRVGFVSPDFHEHPIALFIPPLFRNLDPSAFVITAYNDYAKPDSITRLIRSLVSRWVDSHPLSNAQFVNQVKSDQIDILIDLASHTGGNRLEAFAMRPAPIQISWLAYCGSTGLSAIDYRISDPFMDPPGRFDSFYSEKTLLLPDCHWCYEARVSIPSPQFPNSMHPVFGCFNNFCKINDAVLSLWSRILHQLPASSLFLIAQEGTHQNMTLARFHALGVNPSRIHFFPRQRIGDYYALHNHVHVALDPFPFNGGTTTCDALYMGVPVVSLVWPDRAVGRAGLSLLSQVNLADLAADSPEKYVQTAVNLAQDTPRLKHLRDTLRDTLQSSPLMDAARFGKNFGDLLRHAWTHHPTMLNHKPQ